VQTTGQSDILENNVTIVTNRRFVTQ